MSKQAIFRVQPSPAFNSAIPFAFSLGGVQNKAKQTDDSFENRIAPLVYRAGFVGRRASGRCPRDAVFPDFRSDGGNPDRVSTRRRAGLEQHAVGHELHRPDRLIPARRNQLGWHSFAHCFWRMKNLCGTAGLTALVTVMVKSPLALNRLVATGFHWPNGSATLVLISIL